MNASITLYKFLLKLKFPFSFKKRFGELIVFFFLNKWLMCHDLTGTHTGTSSKQAVILLGDFQYDRRDLNVLRKSAQW